MVSSAERAVRFGQQPATVLLPGSPPPASQPSPRPSNGSCSIGKGRRSLDGENIRLGISRDLGFTAADRSENLRRAEIARLLNNQGITVIAAFVSPDATVRSRFKELVGDERSIEVFVDTPIEVCRQRDNSGLYERADAGEIADFPGVSAPYDHARPSTSASTHRF